MKAYMKFDIVLTPCNGHFFPRGSTNLPRPLDCWGLEITLRHTTLGRNPLDERSTRRRDFYLTTHNHHNRQTSRPPASFKPAIPRSERPQIHASDYAVQWTYTNKIYLPTNCSYPFVYHTNPKRFGYNL